LPSLANSEAVSKGRLEAFSDGVIAVAITLLVLNIVVPEPAKTPDLAKALGHMWPQYAAYAVSFITIGIIWINHHTVIGRLRETDHAILILNLLLLMWIAVLPFATDLMATYLREGHGDKLAAAVYAGAFLGMSITFSGLNFHILFPKSHLLAVQLPHERRRQIISRFVVGLLPYAFATALAAVSPYITLVICALIAAFYALPLASSSDRHPH
jgi:TMEM175 potassium channel family protein